MKKLKSIIPIVFSFLLTLGLTYFIYYKFGYAPWGNRSLATDDGYWQYMDFFGFYKDLLEGKQNLAFSFSNGLGMPGVAFFAYYLSSPWNLLISFFNKESFHDFFDLIVALKFATSAATACYFLKKRFKEKIDPIISVALSLSFAYMQYSFSKAACVMWLDGVYMLPLILLGVYKLVWKKKPLLLSVSVGLAILFNWYTAAIDCMFSGLWFLMEYFIWLSETLERENAAAENNHKAIFNAKTFLEKALSYCGAMALGVGLSCILFLPMLSQMLLATRGSVDWRTLGMGFHGNIINVIKGYSIGMASRRGELSLFCGALILVGVIGFFALTHVKNSIKRLVGIVLTIGILSCYWQPLYFVVSIFQDASSYYYRGEYVCCMTMLFIAGYYFSEKKYKENKLLYVIVVLYCMTLLLFDYIKPDSELKNIYFTVIAQIAALALWMGIADNAGKTIRAKVMSVLLCLLIVFEMGYNASLLMEQYSSLTDTEAYRDYETHQEKLVNRVIENDNSAYRMTQTAARSGAINQLANLNESMGFGYWAIENYISMPVKTQVEFLKKSGYVVYRSILVEKVMSILPIDSLLGVKYVLSPYDYEHLIHKKDLGKGNGKSVYENPYFMPMAFKINSVEEFSEDFGDNTYLWQNALLEYIDSDAEGVIVPAVYSVTEESESSRIFNIEIPEGRYALYGNVPWFSAGEEPWWPKEGAILDLNGRLSMKYAGVNGMTNFYVPTSEGDTGAYIKISSGVLDLFREPQIYLVNLDILKKVSENAVNAEPDDLMVKNGLMTCHVSASEGESLFTSIPYTKGWTITRNGEVIKPVLIEDCLTVIPLVNGDNDIRMEYHTPYLAAGVIASIASMIILFVWSFMVKEKKQVL
ncbi:YfhO family protein [Oribacterium sp. FC2011]|uniref:YfhO family protein n=1 Tax=Oribacterium sp. FC2011 TaxID=1408311 RepID=UPI0004E19314|nr:YfhO family protein [Oribacterium sp. FC2011]